MACGSLAWLLALVLSLDEKGSQFLILEKQQSRKQLGLKLCQVGALVPRPRLPWWVACLGLLPSYSKTWVLEDTDEQAEGDIHRAGSTCGKRIGLHFSSPSYRSLECIYFIISFLSASLKTASFPRAPCLPVPVLDSILSHLVQKLSH